MNKTCGPCLRGNCEHCLDCGHDCSATSGTTFNGIYRQAQLVDRKVALRTELFYKLTFVRDVAPGWLAAAIDIIRYEWLWVDEDHDWV